MFVSGHGKGAACVLTSLTAARSSSVANTWPAWAPHTRRLNSLRRHQTNSATSAVCNTTPATTATAAVLLPPGPGCAVVATRSSGTVRTPRLVITRWADKSQDKPPATPQQQHRSPTTNEPLPVATKPTDSTPKANPQTTEPTSSSTNGSSSSSSTRAQQQLLRQLLGTNSMSSLSSLSSMDAADAAPDAKHQPTLPRSTNTTSNTAVQQQQKQKQKQSPSGKAASSQRQPAPGGLYDDDSAADYDPMLLDVMGFTSVAQYLQYKLDTATKQAKVDTLAAATWWGLALIMMGPLGGPSAYALFIRDITQGGAAIDNLTFLWLFVLGYYTVKGCVMSIATGLRALRERAAEPDRLQELEGVEKQHQRLAFFQLQEQLSRYDHRANRTYTEFALASLLLGVLLIMKGGPDNIALQLETVDQQALSGLVVMMWLFWESYFAGIAALVQLVQLAAAFVNKWQHKRKWGQGSD